MESIRNKGMILIRQKGNANPPNSQRIENRSNPAEFTIKQIMLLIPTLLWQLSEYRMLMQLTERIPFRQLLSPIDILPKVAIMKKQGRSKQGRLARITFPIIISSSASIRNFLRPIWEINLPMKIEVINETAISIDDIIPISVSFNPFWTAV